MSAHTQILTWSNEQSLWRRDALRRLITGAFGPKDEDEVLDLLKAEQDLLKTELKAQPLLVEHLPAESTGSPQVALVGLHDVKNANRLAPGEHLKFSQTGLTLVYGDNGSGKSGYARILKKACRARLIEPILNNVFDAAAAKAPATAIFDVLIGDSETPNPISWEDGKPGIATLSHIAVFDSKCASVYVDNENQVTFIPYNLDCFERLAKLCDRLKERLSTEQRALQATVDTPVVSLAEGTGARTFLDTLAAKTDAELEAATKWTQTQAGRLKELQGLVSEPAKRAIALRQLHAQTKTLSDLIDAAAPFLSKSGISALQDMKVGLKTAQQAAALAASKVFAGEPLSGVGSSAWRSLYEAARAYSEQEAYKGKPFPVMGDEYRCVLCQQVMAQDARERMQRFEDFVRDVVTKQADAARTAWENATISFRAGTQKLSPLEPAFDAALKLEDETIREQLSAYVTAAVALRTMVENSLLQEGDVPIAEGGEIAVPQLAPFLATLVNGASAAEAVTKDDAALQLRKELAELEANQQIHLHKEQVTKRLADFRTLNKVASAIKACSTTGISQKGTELLKEHVTSTFESALTDERKALGIQGIPLRLSSRSPKGAPSHQLKLDQTTFAGNTSAILSDGEHRALALAAFLAEQQMTSDSAPIVVDDPVSSLDHERRLRVAQRLVEEAKKRQVIVFTHDLLFYMDASLIAAEKQVPLTKVGVRRGPKGYGTIDPDGDPWAASVLGKRQAWLEQQLGKLKTLHKDGSTQEYEKEVQFFYSRLRETWERVIEEGLFANVVVRYRRGIETKRLTHAVLEDEMVMRVYHAMTAISAHTGHDTPAAAGAALPDPDEIKTHLDALATCIADIKAQAKAADKRRGKLEKPPTPKGSGSLTTGT